MEIIYTYMQVKVLFFGVLSDVAGSDIKHYQDVRLDRGSQEQDPG